MVGLTKLHTMTQLSRYPYNDDPLFFEKSFTICTPLGKCMPRTIILLYGFHSSETLEFMCHQYFPK